MILDTSAVVAVLFRERGFAPLIRAIGSAAQVAIGAPTLAEAAVVTSARLKSDARGRLARFLQEASVVVLPFGEVHFGAALDAWLRFGKGRHPASLNFGDCLTYATARLANRPLLCVGDDFRKTDLELARQGEASSKEGEPTERLAPAPRRAGRGR